MTRDQRTDPTGRSFLSYRRSRLAEAELLIRAQHELGVPTWQDLADLDELHTESELRRVLSDPTTAAAVLWLTPDVAASATIRKVEAPEIVRREQGGDTFFLVPVAAGGLGYEQAGELLGDRLGVHDLSTWNMRRVRNDPATLDDAREIAGRVLRRRLGAVHDELPEDEPLRLRLMTRRQPGFETGWALSIDWSHRFTVRNAQEGAWEGSLLPALRTIRESIRSRAPGRTLEASGLATLSSGLALGRTFLSLDRDLRLSWCQEASGRPDQVWSLEASREEVPVRIDTRPMRTEGNALAVLLSVTADVEPAFGASKRELPPFRAAVDVRPDTDPFQPWSIERPGQAADFVERTVEAVRRARERLQTDSVHVFGAIPIGLAVLIGQRLNTLGPVQTYEHDPKAGRYTPELLLPEDV